VSASSLNGVKFLYVTASGKATAEFVQSQLKTNLGVDVALDGVDSRTFGSRLRAGNYAFGGPSGFAGDYPDAQDWYDVFVTGSGDQFSGWSNPTYDTAVTSANGASEQAKRDAGYATAEKLLVSEAPVVFLYQPFEWFLVKPYLRGVNVSPSDEQWPGSLFVPAIQIARH
jgi:oligopeptide transport system substrate-binding protein